MSEEEKKKISKLAEEIGYLIGTYGTKEQVELFEKFLEYVDKEIIGKNKIRAKIKRCKNELEENNKNIDYTRKLIYTADETIKKEIQDLEELLEE